MEKVLILLILIFTSCNEGKSDIANNELTEDGNSSLEEKGTINDESYYQFIPDSISNIKIDRFDIFESYQIEKSKFIFGISSTLVDEVWNPDSSISSARFLVLNDKNEVKYKFRGVEDVYLYKPYFYKNKRNNKVIIVCHLAFEYFFGGDVYLFENDKIEYLGNIDVEGKYEETSLIDILKINEINEKIIFTFDSDSITYKPGNEDVFMKNKDVRYEYYGKKLKLIK